MFLLKPAEVMSGLTALNQAKKGILNIEDLTAPRLTGYLNLTPYVPVKSHWSINKIH